MSAESVVVPEWRILQGSIVHSVGEQSDILYLQHKILGVHKGKVAFLEDAEQLNQLQTNYNFEINDVYNLNDGEFVMPGLVDTHIHAPQYANLGLGTGIPLLQWLQEYTYPLEEKFQDAQWAETVYSNVVKRTIANGTTTACYFATIHLEATLSLCDIVEREGQRAFVGNVNMDCDSSELLRQTTQESLENTKKLIKNVFKRKNDLLQVILTPRFALRCSEQLMKSLGDLAKIHNLSIQSHIAESMDETAHISSMFPMNKTYADVYDKCGLLTRKTVLAHGIYLTDECLEILRKRATGIAHCPNSNNTLISGICDVRRLLANGIKVGLGSDVSGGYHVSILDAMRRAIDASATLSHSKPPDYKVLTYEDVFYLATRGGSQVLGLEDKIGNFEVGKDFDGLLIDVNVKNGPIDTMETDSLKDKVERFLFVGDDRNIKQVFVRGRQIKT